MPPSSDPSSRKSGKQRKLAVRLPHFFRVFNDGLTDHQEVQSPSPPRRTGRSAAHRGNLTPAAEQAEMESNSNNALTHVRSSRHRPDAESAPPSYNDDAFSTHDGQSDRVSISSEDESSRSPHQGLGEKSHDNNYQRSRHNGSSSSSNTHITSPKHVNVTGPQFIGEAASTKIMMDFLEKFMSEQLKNARAATGP